MKEYRLQIKVKNNYLFELMEARGISSVAELSRLSDVSAGAVHRIANLSEPALKQTDGWRGYALKLSEFLRCMPEDLYPPKHLRDALEKNRSEIKVDEEDLREFQGLLEADMGSTVDPVAFLEDRERASLAMSAISRLSEREQDVLRGQSEGLTLDEIGERWDISKERVRQIEAKAMRKTRARMKIIDDGGWPVGMSR